VVRTSTVTHVTVSLVDKALAAEVPLPVGVGPLHPRHGFVRRTMRIVLLALVPVVVIVAFGRLRDSLSGAVGQVMVLGPRPILVLVALWIAMVLARGAVYRHTHRDLRISHGVVLDQVNLAAVNGVPGGSLLGIALRYRVSRSLGHSSESAGLTVFASGQAFALGRWLVVVAVLGDIMITGRATQVDMGVLVAALVALGSGVLVWAVISSDSRSSRWLVSAADRLVRRLAQFFPPARSINLERSAERVRSRASSLVRTRGLALLLFGALSTLAGAAMILVVIKGLTPAAAVDPWTILRAYLLARVATSFIPTPGGVGVLDGALTTGLVAAGVDPSAAMASVMVYRAITWAMPIAFGSILYLCWRARLSADAEVDADVHADVRDVVSVANNRDLADAA
jgi:uncharacterized protein (TIRG00374 family)